MLVTLINTLMSCCCYAVALAQSTFSRKHPVTRSKGITALQYEHRGPKFCYSWHMYVYVALPEQGIAAQHIDKHLMHAYTCGSINMVRVADQPIDITTAIVYNTVLSKCNAKFRRLSQTHNIRSKPSQSWQVTALCGPLQMTSSHLRMCLT